MRYGSVCSGMEAASIAWEPLGWTPSFFSDIDPAPRAVLSHRWPTVPLHGDFTTIKDGDYEPIDLLVGGTPCQDFSVAGQRAGLGGERGNLTLEFARLAGRLRPRWMVWENVPGVFSSHAGRDFGAALACFAGYPPPQQFEPPAAGWGNFGVVPGADAESYGLAWRVLDAQYFGVPQRRRRVFVVGYLGDWRRAAAVLLERESLCGNPPPRREAGQGFAGATAPSLTASGRGLDRAGDSRGQDPVVAGSAGLHMPGLRRDERGDVVADVRMVRPGEPGDVAHTLTAKGGAGRMDGESETFVAHAIQAGAARENPSSGPDGVGVQADVAYTLEARPEVQMVAHALRGEGFDASEDGTGRGTPIVPVAFSIMPQNSGKDYKAREVQVAQPLMAGGPVGGNQGGDYIVQPTAFDCKSSGMNGFGVGAISPTLRAMGHKATHQNAGGQVAIAYSIRSDAQRDGIAKTPSADAAGNLRLRAPGMGVYTEVAPTLDASQPHAVAFESRIARNGRGQPSDVVPPLKAQSGESGKGDAAPLIAISGHNGGPPLDDGPRMAVRRLMPVECERLQGAPDNHTLVPYRGKPMADGPRYKLCGNSMASVVMAWIGRRIDLVESIISDIERAGAA